MAASVFVDTNVLLRYTFPGLNHEKECKDQLERYFATGTELWLNNQVIREFCVQATHPNTLANPLTSSQVVHVADSFPARFRIAEETADVRRQFLELISSYNVPATQMHDANFVATMLVQGVSTLCSLNDRHFRRFQDKISLELPQADPA